MKTIKLLCGPTGWSAWHKGDAEVVQLFGTDILPTAYTDSAPAEMVCREIQKLNPDKLVVLA
jgi:hypothetical protein